MFLVLLLLLCRKEVDILIFVPHHQIPQTKIMNQGSDTDVINLFFVRPSFNAIKVAIVHT